MNTCGIPEILKPLRNSREQQQTYFEPCPVDRLYQTLIYIHIYVHTRIRTCSMVVREDECLHELFVFSTKNKRPFAIIWNAICVEVENFQLQSLDLLLSCVFAGLACVLGSMLWRSSGSGRQKNDFSELQNWIISTWPQFAGIVVGDFFDWDRLLGNHRWGTSAWALAWEHSLGSCHFEIVAQKHSFRICRVESFAWKKKNVVC